MHTSRAVMLSSIAAAAAALFGCAGDGAVRSGEPTVMQAAPLKPSVAAYLDARAAEFDRIPAERREQLEPIGRYVADARAAGRPVRLVFVCTHNSRRSHMSQLWAAAAARANGLDVETFSGGTEVTAFNPRAVAAMRRAGFDIDKTSDASNPIYLASMSSGGPPAPCFSKVYDDPSNPSTDFAAVMVCTEADEACPAVPGASDRFALPFVDPKVSDGTAREAATYDERCAQIAREMLYIMTRATSLG